MSSLPRVRARRTRAPSRIATPYARRVGGYVCALACGLGAMTAACEPMTGSAGGPVAATSRPLASYSGHFEPRAVGLGLDLDASSTPRGDRYFRERAQAADIIVRARVSTVTGKQDGPDTSYHVGFKVIEVLGGTHPLGDELVVRIDRSSPGIGVVRSFEGRLVGRTMVVVARAFVRPDGDQEIHVHVAPDTKEVVAAVHEAVILGETAGGTTFTTTSPTTHSR
jgi:hypothetical protein